MKKLSLILLGSAISFAMVAGVFAQSADTTTKTQPPKPQPLPRKLQHYKLKGTVTAVDAAANTLPWKRKPKKVGINDLYRR